MSQNQSSDPIHDRINHLFEDVSHTSGLGSSTTHSQFGHLYSRKEVGWVWETDSNGLLSWCSPETKKYTGFLPQELTGKPFYQFTDLGDNQQKLQHVLDSQTAFQNLRFSFQTQTGNTIQIQLSADVLKNENEDFAGHRGIAIVHTFSSILERPFFIPAISPSSGSTKTGTASLSSTMEHTGGYGFDGTRLQPLGHVSTDIPEKPVLDPNLIRIPIRTGGQLFGVLELEGRLDNSDWNEEQLDYAAALSEHLATSLQDMQAYNLTLQALREMEQADELKSQLIANMSHELRTPLNSIIGFSSVIMKGIDGPVTSTQEQDLKQIHNAGQHLLNLINDILDVSKIEAEKMEIQTTRVDIGALIRDIMGSAVTLVADKPIELLSDIPDDLPHIQADETRLRQILLNLLSNAAKFTDEGQIAISIRSIERQSRQELLFAVMDTGIGIAEEDQHRLFEPFSQLEGISSRPKSGTGLGLSICMHLVELHNGDIWVDSTPGEGSTFIFTLPIQQPLQTTPVVGSILPVSTNKDFPTWLTSSAVAARIQPATDFIPGNITSESAPDLFLIDHNPENNLSWEMIETIARHETLAQIATVVIGFEHQEQRGFQFGPVHFLQRPVKDTLLLSFLSALQPESTESGSFALLESTEQLTQSLKDILPEYPHLKIESHTDAQPLIESIPHNKPVAILFDLFMPGAQGFRLLEHLRTYAIPERPVLIALLPEQPRGHEARQFNRYLEHIRSRSTTSLDELAQCINQMLAGILIPH